MDLLLTLHFAGKLSAKSVALFAYWSARAGAKKPVKEYGFRPDAPTGHYQRHVDRTLGLSKAKDKLHIGIQGTARGTCPGQFTRPP